MANLKGLLEDAARVEGKYRISLPKRIGKVLGLKKGDILFARLADQRLELIPAAVISPDQLWYWTPEWQEMERQADKDIARGRVKRRNSAEQLIEDLKG